MRSLSVLFSGTFILLIVNLCLASGIPVFGVGKPASKEEIALWDTDVRSDGTGLPAGQGTPEEGAVIYQQQCQVCHGVNGKGGPNDQLVGRIKDDGFPFALPKAPKKTIGNYWPWATTLFDYIKRTMPYISPGSMTDNQVYAVTAWLLYANDIIPETMPLNAENLPKIVMPAQRRFVPDNRIETTNIR